MSLSDARHRGLKPPRKSSRRSLKRRYLSNVDTGFSCFQISFEHIPNTGSLFVIHPRWTTLRILFFTYRNDFSRAAFDSLFVACHRGEFRGSGEGLLETFSFVKLEFAFLPTRWRRAPRGLSDDASSRQWIKGSHNHWLYCTSPGLWMPRACQARDNPMKMDRVTGRCWHRARRGGRERETSFLWHFSIHPYTSLVFLYFCTRKLECRVYLLQRERDGRSVGRKEKKARSANSICSHIARGRRRQLRG